MDINTNINTNMNHEILKNNNVQNNVLNNTQNNNQIEPIYTNSCGGSYTESYGDSFTVYNSELSYNSQSIFQNNQNDQAQDDILDKEFQINLSLEEKIRCLEEILTKIKKILYVYDKSQEPNSNYNYKVFCGGVLIYVSSSNILFNGELVNIVVNMNAILHNNFNKSQLKRIVFETKNFTEFLLSKYTKELNELTKNSH